MSNYKVKIVILGDEGVGKTSIILRYTKDRFTEDYKPTLGADFAVKKLRIGGDDITLYLWDIGGTRQYKNLHPYYFKDTNIFLLVYDLSSMDSYENATHFWLEDITKNNGSVPIMLVGNKQDLIDGKQGSSEKSSQDIPKLISLFKKTSAKTGHNIDNLFLKILESLKLKKPEV